MKRLILTAIVFLFANGASASISWRGTSSPMENSLRTKAPLESLMMDQEGLSVYILSSPLRSYVSFPKSVIEESGYSTKEFLALLKRYNQKDSPENLELVFEHDENFHVSKIRAFIFNFKNSPFSF